jgi:hypothetical protein
MNPYHGLLWVTLAPKKQSDDEEKPWRTLFLFPGRGSWNPGHRPPSSQLRPTGAICSAKGDPNNYPAHLPFPGSACAESLITAQATIFSNLAVCITAQSTRISDDTGLVGSIDIDISTRLSKTCPLNETFTVGPGTYRPSTLLVEVRQSRKRLEGN